jgi:hypothetical protein
MAKTNGKRNRRAGHTFEREVVNALKTAGYTNAVSSRSANRLRDAQGIDIVNSDESVHGRLPFNIQCKNYSRTLKYNEILGKMPKLYGVINVILHKQTKSYTDSSGKSTFQPVGKYAILSMEDFLNLVKTQANGNSTNTID